MKNLVTAVLFALAPALTVADESVVKFRITVTQDGRVIGSPSFLANVGQPTSIRMGEGISLEALAKPPEPDGRAWTQIRVTYAETDNSKFVNEIQMRHATGLRTGSIDLTDPLNRRYRVEIGD